LQVHDLFSLSPAVRGNRPVVETAPRWPTPRRRRRPLPGKPTP